ncbi:MAG: RluA family pseudouridine synthase [Clostridia bacterium]|nr:RluA family pseudouridine synthase [Clostridia bacterium]
MTETDEYTVSFTAEEADAGKRADVLAAEKAQITRSAAANLLLKGAVTVNGAECRKNYKAAAGDIFTVELPEPQPCDAVPENIPIDVAYEDEDVIVVNKPQGMVVHPAPGHISGTLVSALLYHCGDSLSDINGVIRPGIVHRIDRDTSGLIAAAKNNAAHLSLAAQLEDHSMARVYYAVVLGNLPERGTVDAPIARHPSDRKKMAVAKEGGRRAVTHYETVEELGGFTLVRLKLETGRTHQIRVHMAHIGHPVIFDPVYGRPSQFEKQHPGLMNGQCLHAGELSFTHPSTGERVTVKAPLPEYFEKTLNLLRSR